MHIKCVPISIKGDKISNGFDTINFSMCAIPLNLISNIYVIPRKNDWVTDIFVEFGVNNLNDMIIYKDCLIGDPNTQLFLWKSIRFAYPNTERTKEDCLTLNYSTAGKIARELEQAICEFISHDNEFTETTTTELCSEGVPQFPKVEPNGNNKGE